MATKIDYLNLKVSDITTMWVRQHFNIDSERGTTTVRVSDRCLSLFDNNFEMSVDNLFLALRSVEKDFRDRYVSISESNPTMIQHSVYTDYDLDYSSENHYFEMFVEYQRTETDKEVIDRLVEETKRNIRSAKAKAKAAEKKKKREEQQAVEEEIQLKKEFKLYQKLKKKFEE